ncbi:MAG: efflux RND transporter periplasmic adaptor subunit [Sedimentisphaerales bacterium]|nr:efflux RND transporter periplasmic adaptor subunit [Sedimentisphaerales bacterium]
MKVLKILLLITIVILIGSAGYIVSKNIELGHGEHEESSVLIDESYEGELEEDHEEQVIEITPEQIKEMGLDTSITGPGIIDTYLSLTGQIWLNQDTAIHIIPRVEGIVVKVNKQLGDVVQAGDILAIIESRDLADDKAEYLAANERYKMAQLTFQREEKLWSDKISSEQEYLDSRQAFTEAGIEKRIAEQKLYAIGFDKSYIENLPDEPDELLTRFEIKAPFDSTVIEKHIVLGEQVGTDSAIYVLADLNTVWIDLNVYPKDLGYIRKNQEVIISANSDISDVNGVIDYISPTVGHESRTALARVVLSNESGLFRPGLFVNAKVSVSQTNANIVVPKESIQNLEGQKCVFVKDEHGFEPVFVETGLENATHVEISSGLIAGQEYVTEGAFSLKSMIITSTLDSHAGHGH